MRMATNEIPVQVEDKGTVANINAIDEKENPIKYSAWFITVNSNQKPKDIADARRMSMILKEAFIRMVSDDGNRIIKVLVPGHRPEPPFVRNIDLKIAGEVGHDPRGGRVHIHAFLEIQHQSKLRLNYKAINEILREKLCNGPEGCFPNIYVNIKLTRSTKTIEAYLRKDPITPVDELVDKMTGMSI